MIEALLTFHRFCGRAMWRLTLSKAARVKPLQGLTPSLQIAGTVLFFDCTNSLMYKCTVHDINLNSVHLTL